MVFRSVVVGAVRRGPVRHQAANSGRTPPFVLRGPQEMLSGDDQRETLDLQLLGERLCQRLVNRVPTSRANANADLRWREEVKAITLPKRGG
jgi:hypothetical protein